MTVANGPAAVRQVKTELPPLASATQLGRSCFHADDFISRNSPGRAIIDRRDSSVYGRSAPMTEMDIGRSANMLLKCYGDETVSIASKRADALLDQGDVQGCSTWVRIAKAIDEGTQAAGPRRQGTVKPARAPTFRELNRHEPHWLWWNCSGCRRWVAVPSPPGGEQMLRAICCAGIRDARNATIVEDCFQSHRITRSKCRIYRFQLNIDRRLDMHRAANLFTSDFHDYSQVRRPWFRNWRQDQSELLCPHQQ